MKYILTIILTLSILLYGCSSPEAGKEGSVEKEKIESDSIKKTESIIYYSHSDLKGIRSCDTLKRIAEVSIEKNNVSLYNRVINRIMFTNCSHLSFQIAYEMAEENNSSNGYFDCFNIMNYMYDTKEENQKEWNTALFFLSKSIELGHEIDYPIELNKNPINLDTIRPSEFYKQNMVDIEVFISNKAPLNPSLYTYKTDDFNK